MALEASNIVQQAFGTLNSGGSVTVGFDTAAGFSPVGAGNTVIVLVAAALAVSTPAGFVSDTTYTGGTAVWAYAFRKSNTAGGETTWTLSQSAATATCWAWGAWEVTGLDLVSPRAKFGSDAGTTITTLDLVNPGNGESGSAQRLDTAKFGLALGASATSDFATESWAYLSPSSGNVNWAKVGDYRAVGPSTNLLAAFYSGFSGMAVVNAATLQGLALGVTSLLDEGAGLIITYASPDSPTLDPIVMGTGFEFGTHHGITGGPTASPGPAQICDAVSGTHGTAYQVTTTAPKNGSYHLRITNSAAAGWVRWSTNTLGTGLGQAVFGGYVKCVSATTNPAVLVELAPAAGSAAQVVYNVTTSKLGVRWGTGTVAYQSATTALGSYAWVDLRAVFNATTWTLVWRCEESGAMVTQTGPANLTSQTASTWSTATLGATVAQTAVADYDDVCLSNATTDYPLGRHKVVLLVPDTAVAAILGGSAGANMSALTNNVVGSTLTTTGAANIPALLDEVPPNFSATADGIAAVTAGTTDNVILDMTTYTAASTERIDAVRVYLCGWAASTATASLGLRADTGSGAEEQMVSGSVVHGTFINTTTGTAVIPGWYAKNYPQAASGWTQTLLDGLRVLFGYSSDATPDIGALAIYAEVAVATDFVPALPGAGEWIFQRAPRPVEQSQVVGPYAQTYPSTFLGG